MGHLPTASRHVGRDAELAAVLTAVAAVDPDRPVILLSGEAGIGKSRLIAEASRRLDAGAGGEQGDAAHRDAAWDDANGGASWTVARGSCLRLADGELPFAPILEVLDGLRERLPARDRERLRGRLAGSAPERTTSANARMVRFVEIHDALARAAAAGPVLVVLDDVHWADRSTLDLLRFLARRLRGGSVVLLVAYRADELHRQHPLRPVIADLRRDFVREHVELRALESRAVAEQIAELRGTEPGAIAPDVVRAIVQRADGNPFYVEQLVALDSARSALPASVRDVLLARLSALDPTTLRVLGACAVIGREVDADLVQAATRLEAPDVRAALETAVDHAILVQGSVAGTYRYRHALLEEAVHDDLLPLERVELHGRVATALLDGHTSVSRAAVAPGELARHLDLGGQSAAAIDAYLEAAALALRALAWAEGAAAWERAAELAAARPSDEAASARVRSLAPQAAEAMAWTGGHTRAIAMLRSAIPAAERAGAAVTAASMWLTLGRLLNDIGDETGSRRTTPEAARLLPPGTDAVLEVELLFDRSINAWIDAFNREARELAEQALDGAERLGDPGLIFRALLNCAETRIYAGDVDRALEEVERARQLETAHGWLDVYGHLAANIGAAFADVGVLDTAFDLLQEGIKRGRELGLSESWDPWNVPGLAYHAYQTGAWADADRHIEVSRAFRRSGLPGHYLETCAAQLAAGRGDLASCDAALAAATRHQEGLGGEAGAYTRLARLDRANAAGDPAAALAEAEAALAGVEGTDSFVLRARLAAGAALAAADLVRLLHPRRDAGRIAEARATARRMADYATEVDAGHVVPGTRSVAWTRACAELAEAAAARADGADDPEQWLSAAEQLAAMGMAPAVAETRFRAAEAALAAGDRQIAVTQLRHASDAAKRIGMTVLLGRIDALATAGRLDLAASETAGQRRDAVSDPWGLSPREREVLALIAQGRTNGEIGERLYISTKTASVHVTHILTKLGVSSRTEAALLASQTGALDRREDEPVSRRQARARR